MVSKDDEYWHSIMQALGDEFIENGKALGSTSTAGSQWIKAGKEVKATASQALDTAGVAESIIKAREGKA